MLSPTTPFEPSTQTPTKFQFVEHFEKLDHKLVLRTLAHRDLDEAFDATLLLGSQAWNTKHFVPSGFTDIMGYVKVGNFVRAIKDLRQATGLGLYEAKCVVDTLANSPHRAALSEFSLATYTQFVEYDLAPAYVAPVVKAPEPAKPEVITYIGTILMPDVIRSTFPDSDAGEASIGTWATGTRSSSACSTRTRGRGTPCTSSTTRRATSVATRASSPPTPSDIT